MILQRCLKRLLNPRLLKSSENNKATCTVGPFIRYERKFPKKLGHEEIEDFLKVFPAIIDVFDEDIKIKNIPDVELCFKDVLIKNVPTGKKNRALSFLRIYKNMENSENITPEKSHLAHIMGWCLEIVNQKTSIQASCIILDDIVDDCKYRRGIKCWHQNTFVGRRAIVDAVLLENITYLVLQKHFSQHPIYIPILQFIQESIRKMEYGEIMDSMALKKNNPDLKRFNINYYQTVARYKTSPSIVEQPYYLARILSNNLQSPISKIVEEVMIKFGEFYQIQNDFLDCYGDKNNNYKTGNDIQEGKCSWLVVTALEKASLQQRKLLENHYGRTESESVKIVKDLYAELNIPKEYAKREWEVFDFINKNIEEVSTISDYENIFLNLDYIYEKYI